MSFITRLGQLRDAVATYTALPLTGNVIGDLRITTDTANAYSCTKATTSENDSFTKLMLHLDNNVTDSELTAKTITNSNVSFSSSIKKFGTHAGSFNGSNSKLTIPNHSDFDFGTGDFTVDLWYYPLTNDAGGAALIGNSNNQGAGTPGWSLYSSGGNIYFTAMFPGGFQILANAITTNAWNHIAVARSGSSVKLYVNGTSVASGTYSGNITSSANLYIGFDTLANLYPANGYMDEIRISKGTARWTSNFTPETSAYGIGSLSDWTLITNSSFNDLIGSPSASTLEVDNAVKTIKALTANLALVTFEYISRVGWTSFKMFDGFVDKFENFFGDTEFQSKVNQGTSTNFTLGVDNTVISSGYTEHKYYFKPTTLAGGTPVYTPVDSATSPHTLTANGAAILSGDNLLMGNSSLYLDGINSYVTSPDSADWQLTSAISGGIDSNVKLMLHMDGSNGSTTFTDSSSSAKTVTRVGSPVISTTQSQFGGASGSFPGAGNYLTLADSADWAYGTGDFTIDFWTRLNNTGTLQAWYEQFTSGDNATTLFIAGGHIYFFSYNGSYIMYANTTGTPLVNNTWHHIAVVRKDVGAINGFKIYVDGVSQTLTWNNNLATGASFPDYAATLRIGFSPYGYGTLNGYMDELRISKGIARWTSDFTPPTSAYSSSSSYTDYTVEANICPTAYTDLNAVIMGQTGAWSLAFDGSSNHYLKFSTTSGFTLIAPSTINLNSWTHVAVVQNSGTVNFYLDGVLQASVAGNAIIDSSSALAIGATSAGANLFTGYIEEVRISDNARYTATFTPSNTAFSNDANTKLLAHFNVTAVTNMTLNTLDIATDYIPTSARVIVFEEDVDVIKPNVDLTMEVSRDGGTTFTTVILQKDSEFDNGVLNIYSGTIDLSTQPSGQNMRYRLKTLNNKDCKIRGTSLQWAA